ncbi:prepilin peptidase [Candidatus Pacearchaeota archaeon]|nr:prepilin peptidase [Candidatus Pacearchaeota archaeon]
MIEFGFLFWLFLGGIIVAGLQDLKRREVDNWLCLFLMVSGFVFVFYGAILSGDSDVIFHAGFLLVVMFVIMNLFYYARVFAGGDAKLLVSMTVFFLGASFFGSMVKVGIFLLLLMISGSAYGLIYSLVLYFKDFKKVNAKMGKLAVGNWWSMVVLGVGVVLMLFGFWNWIFFMFGILIFIFPLLYIFARGLENVSMIREVSGRELQEGDWLVEDVIARNREVIKADWDGLSLSDIELLKNKRKILIKDGLPFVPAFLIAFLGYAIFLEKILVYFGLDIGLLVGG